MPQVYRQINRKPTGNSGTSTSASAASEAVSAPVPAPESEPREASGLSIGAPNMVPNPLFQAYMDSQPAQSNGQGQMQDVTMRSVEDPSAESSFQGFEQSRDRSGSLDSTLDECLSGKEAAGDTRKAAVSRRLSEMHKLLVGSLTSVYPFVERGLCKKVRSHIGFHDKALMVHSLNQTISLEVDGSHQHLVSYYTLEDVYSGRLRTPSTFPELLAMTISPNFLLKSNFRVPPKIEIGTDGIPRFRGEAEDSPNTPPSPVFSPAPATPASFLQRNFLNGDSASPPPSALLKSARKPNRARAASAAAFLSGKHRTISDGAQMEGSNSYNAFSPYPMHTGPSSASIPAPYGSKVRYEPYPTGLTDAIVPFTFRNMAPTQGGYLAPEENPSAAINLPDFEDSRPMTAPSVSRAPQFRHSTAMMGTGAVSHGNSPYMQSPSQFEAPGPRRKVTGQAMDFWDAMRPQNPPQNMPIMQNMAPVPQGAPFYATSSTDISPELHQASQFQPYAGFMQPVRPQNVESFAGSYYPDPRQHQWLPEQQMHSEPSRSRQSLQLERVVLRHPEQ